MLATPIEVKKACKAGTYKKNYKMCLYDPVPVEYFKTQMVLYDGDTFIITESGKYRFYNSYLGITFSVTYTENGTTTIVFEHTAEFTDLDTKAVVEFDAVQNSGYYTVLLDSVGPELELQKYSYTQTEIQPTKEETTFTWNYDADGWGQSAPLKAGKYKIFTYYGSTFGSFQIWRVKPDGTQTTISNRTNHSEHYNYAVCDTIEDGDIIKAKTSVTGSALASIHSEAYCSYNMVLDNEFLVAETVNIDERMATGSELKFGLCEGSSLEFQYFNYSNINGKTVQAVVDIQYLDSNNELSWYSIPMGFYTVEECPRQFSTGIYKVTAYNKLQSTYLDQKVNDQIIEIVTKGMAGTPGEADIATILDSLLGDYAIERPYKLAEIRSFSHRIIGENGKAQFREFENSSVNNYWVAYLYDEVDVHIENYDSLNVYRIWANAKRVYDELLSYVPDEIWEKEYMYNNQRHIFEEFFTGCDAQGNELGNRLYLDAYIRTKAGSLVRVDFNTDNRFSDSAATDWVTNTKDAPWDYFVFRIPVMWKRVYSVVTPDVSDIFSADEKEEAKSYSEDIISNLLNIKIEERDASALEKYTFTPADAMALPDVTLRELQSAIYETQCQYGQLDRQTDLFSGVELNGGGLYPAETLYPADSLYPNNGTGGQGIHPYPSEYSQLWTDTMGEQSFRYLIITYKTLDENNQEVDAVLQRTVNADGTTDYNMSDNWLFRNLVWTAADVGDYADAMVLKMQNIRWFPFEMWAAGLPYVETGDAIEITDREGNTHNSYILQRQLQGIQNLQDTYVNGELDIF